MDVYIPDPETSIIHYVTVDFTKRFVETPVHLVQYDSSLPILAITLLQSGNSFTIPEGAVALLRYGKTDRTFVILDPLGVSSDRSTVYFEVPYQMTVEYGSHNPIVELWIDSKVAASSSFVIVVDKNPVTNAEIESTTDYAALRRFKDAAAASAEAAATSETNAATSESNASTSETNAANSANAAAASAADALTFANNAANSETHAALSETNAAASELAAKNYETNAKASADRSEQILDSMEQMVVGGLTLVEADELPSTGQNDKTLYSLPTQMNNVPSSYRDLYIWKNNAWKLLGGFRGTMMLSTIVSIAAADWDETTREAIKTVAGVSATNTVYTFLLSGSDFVYCKTQATNQLTFGLEYDNVDIPTETTTFSILIADPVLAS